MKFIQRFLITLSFTLGSAAAALHPVRSESQFIQHLVTTDHFKRSFVTNVLHRAKASTQVIHKISHPAEKRDWDWYHRFFVKTSRIKQGVTYWRRHQQILNLAQKRYGVPPQIIVSIIGIETLYGQHKGTIPTINALYTLAFHHHDRTGFFQKELEKFFILCRSMNFNIEKVTGSYAGALGIPQFMPSIYLALAKSASDRRPNLFNNNNDAILSVANYIAVHHWQPHEPLISQTLLTQSPPASWITPKPLHTVRWYQQHHVKTKSRLWPHSKATLIRLDTQDPHPYWLASTNFFAILSYNSSKNYGMAVYSLSQSIKRQFHDNHHT